MPMIRTSEWIAKQILDRVAANDLIYQEIHPFIDRICAASHPAIVDIGCAEGYSTIGLAMRISGATVSAFDTHTGATPL